MSEKHRTAPTIETPLASWDQKPGPTMPNQTWTAYAYTKVQVTGDVGQRYSSDRLTPLGSVQAPDYPSARGLCEQRWGGRIDYVEPVNPKGEPIPSPKRR